jgi:hypothetical protein
MRSAPSIRHLIFDYAFDRDGNDFESREHILSSILAWVSADPAKDLSASQFAETALQRHLGADDCHWHAWGAETFAIAAHVASIFCSREVEVLRFGVPTHESWKIIDKSFDTMGEIILVLRMDSTSCLSMRARANLEIEAARIALSNAQSKILP